MTDDESVRFAKLTYEDFRRLAVDPSLNPHEKIGFPTAYREARETAILGDIVSKLTRLNLERQVVFDIGPGCGRLAGAVIDLCADHGHTLLLGDSAEMLAQLPDRPFISKVPGYFPRDAGAVLERYRASVDVILAYSVLHYVFVDSNVFQFLDAALGLLAAGGQLLIGDIPNVSKRKRFFSSETGVRYHQQFMQTGEVPEVHHNVVEPDRIDDAVVLGLVTRARNFGYDAYVVPQAPGLPMANRREDILIVRP